MVEGDETFTVTLAVPQDATLPAGVSLSGTAASATGTIADDDTGADQDRPVRIAVGRWPRTSTEAATVTVTATPGGWGGAHGRYGGHRLGRQRHGDRRHGFCRRWPTSP